MVNCASKDGCRLKRRDDKLRGKESVRQERMNFKLRDELQAACREMDDENLSIQSNQGSIDGVPSNINACGLVNSESRASNASQLHEP
jgi:hypothetical protein